MSCVPCEHPHDSRPVMRCERAAINHVHLSMTACTRHDGHSERASARLASRYQLHLTRTWVHGSDQALHHDQLERAATARKHVSWAQECAAMSRILMGVARRNKKAGVVPLIRCRGLCIPLWTVFPPLQVVLSSACSVASLSRFPSHYLPGHPHLREGALAAYLFG